MTDILKYIDVNPDEAKKMAQRMHVKKDDIQFIRKGYEVKVEEFDDDERTITARVSTADRDRDGEIVEPKGIDLKDYQKNPVLLWAHQYSTPAIGKCLWSKSDSKGLVCKFMFAPTQFAEDIYQLYKGAFMRAFSIGFIPMEYDQKTKTHEKISLLEVSAVPVPANQNALVMEAYQKGLIKSESLKHDLEIDGEEIDIEDAAPVTEKDTIVSQKDTAPAPGEASPDAPDSAPEAPVVKAFDMNKNPSVWDILNAVWRQFASANQEARPGGIEPNKMLEDFYPVNYPNGHLVYSEPNEDGVIQDYVVDYTYSKGVVALGENPVPVVIAWKRGEKGFQPKADPSIGGMIVKLRMDTDEFDAQMKAIKDELTTLKTAKDAAMPAPPAPVADPPAAPEPEDILSGIETNKAGQITMTPEEVEAAVRKAVERLDISKAVENAVSLKLDKLRGRVR